ncbi:hypothetical protein VNI00_009376 [Paramarasmius palmivorus]|uniref:Uncharacterized protein n=1 Tax=Paramarasmius palmivorus TaxID=297713 RepID=A0AAW0CS70_9AGAR
MARPDLKEHRLPDPRRSIWFGHLMTIKLQVVTLVLKRFAHPGHTTNKGGTYIIPGLHRLEMKKLDTLLCVIANARIEHRSNPPAIEGEL